MSIAPGWVRVKKSRLGIFGPTLYHVRDFNKTAETAKALTFLFPNHLLPSAFTDPMLCAFANAIFHCSTCSEVAIVLNRAIEQGEVRAARDREIVSEYAAFMAENETPFDTFYDASALPHSKEAIVDAIEGEILRERADDRVKWLETGSLFLWNYLHGVGSTPLPLPAPRSAAQFKAIADQEAKLIDERIAAAVRLRKERQGLFW
jgi:hypothetical protein